MEDDGGESEFSSDTEKAVAREMETVESGVKGCRRGLAGVDEDRTDPSKVGLDESIHFEFSVACDLFELIANEKLGMLDKDSHKKNAGPTCVLATLLRNTLWCAKREISLSRHSHSSSPWGIATLLGPKS